MQASRPSRILTVVALAVVALAVAAAPAAAGGRGGTPSPGAAGLGDRLFPNLGNGGYDARHYHLDLRYGSAPADPMEGTVTIAARAKQSLSRFNLDWAGASVGSVSVNGRPAAWTLEGEELVITPKRPLRKHRKFSVEVSDFVAVPTEPSDDPTSTGFFITPDGTATAPQPDLAHRIFPSNDHPSDKASYTFSFDVPSDVVAVANGVPAGHRERGGRTTWRYVQRQPMATELVQLAVGGYDLLWAGRHRGVPIRNVIAPSLRPLGDPAVELTPQHLDWMTARVGRYPFDIYGSLIVDAELGFALETQTISLYDKVWFTEYGQGTWDPTMVHELSHEWFGNSVSPDTWSDLWLNEGHASWYEFVYAEEEGFLAEDTIGYPDDTGYATLEELMRAVYAHGDQWRADDLGACCATGRAGQGVSLSWRWESNPGTAPGSLSWAAGRLPGQLRQLAGTISSVRATGWLNDSTYLREGATRWQAVRTSASRDCRGRMVGSWPCLTSACGLGRASPGCWGLTAPQGLPSCGFGPPGCRPGLALSGFPAGIRESHLADARRGGTRRRRRWGAWPGRRWSAGYPAS